MGNKIVNDPVYGFIEIHSQLCHELIEHPWFQRLKYIRQLGMAFNVYPGAEHTRFQHSIGAMYLMGEVLGELKRRGTVITPEEEEGALAAILLHDIGHGPFSHSLEGILNPTMMHESLSLELMKRLNRQFSGQLSLAIEIFEDKYQKRFLHSLISGQLDMDRMDFLRRDSYFSGVVEGTINSDRILKMLMVVDDKLVVDAKGIYSIERFLSSRRLMYWQVYMHKTVIALEKLLSKIVQRARELSLKGKELFSAPALSYFLHTEDFDTQEMIANYVSLSDDDLISAIKVWAFSEDRVLSMLCSSLVNRTINRVRISPEPFSENLLEELKRAVSSEYGIDYEDAGYFVYSGKLHNQMYKLDKDLILILDKAGNISELSENTDNRSVESLTSIVDKYYISAPKAFLKYC